MERAIGRLVGAGRMKTVVTAIEMFDDGARCNGTGNCGATGTNELAAR